MNKLFITSALAIALTIPAIADPVVPNISPSAESADCTQPVLGTTTGTSNLQASWTPNTLNIDWYNGETKLTSNTCTYDSGITVPSTNPTKTGYTFAGWTVKQLTNILASLDATINGNHIYGHGWYNDADYCNNDGSAGQEQCSASALSDLALNEWKTEFSYGTVYGEASCVASLESDMAYLLSNIDAVMNGNMNAETFLTNYAQLAGAEKAGILQDIYSRMLSGAITRSQGWGEVLGKLLSSDNNTRYNKNTTGQYCFCKATNYTPLNRNKQNVASSSWVFNDDIGYDNADNCAQNCASGCAAYLQYFENFRRALFGVTQ